MEITGSLQPTGTLFGVPRTRQDAGTPGAVVIGIPFDMGTHASRIGARSGPAHVRHSSLLVAESAEDLGVNPIEELRVVDLGDVRVVPGQVESSFETIADVLSAAFDSGAIPITLGGDGAVTLPQLREARLRYPDLVLVHFDAHTDAYDIFEPSEFNNANSFVHAAREGLIEPEKSFHIGIRDTELAGHPGVIAFAESLGYQVRPMRQIRELGVAAVVSEVRSVIGDRPVYFCWDMDVFDPSVAPGVVTPAWGGLTVAEGFDFLRALTQLNVVAFDLNTVSPPHDLGDQTGSLAAHVVLEFLTGTVLRRVSAE